MLPTTLPGSLILLLRPVVASPLTARRRVHHFLSGPQHTLLAFPWAPTSPPRVKADLA